MNRYEWAQALKVGDKVMYTPAYSGAIERVEKVTRLTKTMIVVSGERFRRETGSSIGSGWHTGHINEYSRAREATSKKAVQRRELLHEVGNYNCNTWGKLDSIQLQIIVDIVEGAKK